MRIAAPGEALATLLVSRQGIASTAEAAGGSVQVRDLMGRLAGAMLCWRAGEGACNEQSITVMPVMLCCLPNAAMGNESHGILPNLCCMNPQSAIEHSRHTRSDVCTAAGVMSIWTAAS